MAAATRVRVARRRLARGRGSNRRCLGHRHGIRHGVARASAARRRTCGQHRDHSGLTARRRVAAGRAAAHATRRARHRFANAGLERLGAARRVPCLRPRGRLARGVSPARRRYPGRRWPSRATLARAARASEPCDTHGDDRTANGVARGHALRGNLRQPAPRARNAHNDLGRSRDRGRRDVRAARCDRGRDCRRMVGADRGRASERSHDVGRHVARAARDARARRPIRGIDVGHCRPRHPADRGRRDAVARARLARHRQHRERGRPVDARRLVQCVSLRRQRRASKP